MAPSRPMMLPTWLPLQRPLGPDYSSRAILDTGAATAVASPVWRTSLNPSHSGMPPRGTHLQIDRATAMAAPGHIPSRDGWRPGWPIQWRGTGYGRPRRAQAKSPWNRSRLSLLASRSSVQAQGTSVGVSARPATWPGTLFCRNEGAGTPYAIEAAAQPLRVREWGISVARPGLARPGLARPGLARPGLAADHHYPRRRPRLHHAPLC